MDPEDKKIFFMDIRVISWDDYLRSYILAARKYCLKDDPSTLPRARRVFACLYVVDLFVKIGFAFLFMWLLYSWMMPYKITIGTAIEMP